ncbi:MAG: M16 family metallopeptidase [Mycobacteriaceae bacterium]
MVAAPALHRYTLDNGLRVLLAPDPTNPVVAVSVHYDVGFRSEPEGRTGFAHLFEHLMFQGSESLAKLEHFRVVQSSGGVFNGSTHPDYTDYFQVLPSAALERALFLEADRMRAPKITAENLANQVEVVKEEIRLNVHNRPYGGLPWILLPPVLYDTFPNAHNGYGDFSHLEEASTEDCASFFDTYYAPSNAVLTVAGDFEPDQARELVRRHFGDVPARPRPERPSFAEPVLTTERWAIHRDPHAPLPAVAIGYRLPDPAVDLGGYLAAVVLGAVLTDGDSARLQRTLVQRDGLVVDISAGCGLMGDPLDARDPDPFVITAIHGADNTARAVLDAIDSEVAELAENGPSAQELAGVVARWRAGSHRERDRVATRALDLGSAELLFGRPELGVELPELIAGVTAEQVAAAAATLTPGARAVLEVTPGANA